MLHSLVMVEVEAPRNGGHPVYLPGETFRVVRAERFGANRARREQAAEHRATTARRNPLNRIWQALSRAVKEGR